MPHHLAVYVDDECPAEHWWEALDRTAPALADTLRNDGQAIMSLEVWAAITALPGFAAGPSYAPHALLSEPEESDLWQDVVRAPHTIFDELR